MKLGIWLMAMMEPLIAKVLLSLGFSVVSVVGMETILTGIKGQMVTSMNTLPPDLIGFALFVGVGKGLGIIFGALATKLTLWGIQSATSLVGKAPS